MKNLKIITTLLLLIVIVSCKKDDDNTASENQAPEAFNLLSVANNETNVDVMPTFSWDTATDPEEDAVTYSLLIDIDSNPTVEIATGINDTTFTLTERLALAETLFWKVIATDANGGTTESETFTFTTRNLNTEATLVNASAGFSKRRNHTSVVFDDKIWVI